MSSYQAKNEKTLARQLKVEELAIPLFVTANAVPANKTQASDEPALLFINTQGISGITLANGAVDSAAELAAITFASATDTTGIYNLLLRVGEQVVKVVSAQVVRRDGNEVISCTFPTGALNGISSAGDKIVLNCDSAVDLSATNYDASLLVRYVTAK